MTLHPLIRKTLRIAKKVFLWMFIAQLVYIILLRWINPPITMTQFVSVIKGDGLKRDYISCDEMGPNAKLAVMASEDQRFPDHYGFDTKSIEKAIEFNEEHKNKKRGASTISQQVAKNVFLWQGGGWFRKGLEVYFTFMIETLWSKERILEMYLNVSEMGEGVFGIQAAARHNFGKDAGELTRLEAAEIAGCLPNPKRFTIKPMTRYVQMRGPAIMRQMSFIEPDPDIQKLIK